MYYRSSANVSKLMVKTQSEGPRMSFLTFVRVPVLHWCCNAAEASPSCGTCPEVRMRPCVALLTAVCTWMLLVGSWTITAEAAGWGVWPPALTDCNIFGCLKVCSQTMKWFWRTASSCLTNAGRPGDMQDAEQLDLVLLSSLTWTGGRGVSWAGESACWHLFSTSSWIFSSSTILCSCSSFLISSSIWRSLSWRRLSFSESFS